MKKLLLILSVAVLLTSCKSDEEKLNDMIADAVKSSLYVPDSYEPVNTQCDSLMTNMFSSDNIKAGSKIVDLTTEVKNLQSKIESDTEFRDIYKYDKTSASYQKYTSQIEKNTTKKEKLEQMVIHLAAELQKEYWKERVAPKFSGYIITHRFRAKNQNDISQFGDMIFVMNKTKNKIIAAYDPEEPTFDNFLKVIYAYMELGADNMLNTDENIDGQITLLSDLFDEYKSY